MKTINITSCWVTHVIYFIHNESTGAYSHLSDLGGKKVFNLHKNRGNIPLQLSCGFSSKTLWNISPSSGHVDFNLRSLVERTLFMK